VAFIGGGPGGYVGAIRAAQRGARTVVIEKSDVGGVCLNTGCIPTKTILSSASALRSAREAARMGLRLDGIITPDLPAIWSRKDRVVETLARGIKSLFKSHGVELVNGAARLEGKGRISVSGENGVSEIEAAGIVIATGSRPAELPGLGFDGKLVVNSTDMLAEPSVPENLLIVGAGAIGMEFAEIYSAFGSKVTLVEMLARPLPTEDEDISKLVAREFKKRKINIITSRKLEKLDKGAGKVKARLSDGTELEADRVLVSVGRALNSDGIGLENAGIKPGKRGEIPVNERMETGVDGIYAVGDVAGGPLLAHVASAGGLVAAENATGGDRKLDLSVLPWCVYTYPEVAGVGLREHQAAEKGIEYKVGRFAVRGIGMAQATGEIAGEVKVITDASGKLLGVHVAAVGAGLMVHEAAVAIAKGMTVDEWAAVIHAHPSMSETLVEAAEDVSGTAVHLPGAKK